LDGAVDPLAHHAHDPIGGGQEKFALAGEIAVDGAFADAELFREELRIAVGVAVLGEQLRGGFQICSQRLLRSVSSQARPGFLTAVSFMNQCFLS